MPIRFATLFGALVLLSGCVTGDASLARDRYYYDPPRHSRYYYAPPPPVYYRPAPDYRPIIIYRDRPHHHRHRPHWRYRDRDRW